METTFSLGITATTINQTNASKTFSGVSETVTSAFGTQFAKAYLDLTSLTGKTTYINKRDVTDIAGF